MIRLAILLSLVMFVCITKIAFCAPDVKDEVKYKEPKPSSWVEITSRERLISVLELIGHQTRGNYEKIHTWQGTCNEINQSTLSISTLRQLGYSKLTFPISVSFTAKHNFRIDLINNKIYSDYENGNAEFVNETDGKIVDVPFKREDSEKNIVTQEHYLSYSPNSPYLNPFRTKIKTKTLPTAFRKDTRLAMSSLFSNSIDPRILMGRGQGECYPLPRGGPPGARRVGAPGGPPKAHHLTTYNATPKRFSEAPAVNGAEPSPTRRRDRRRNAAYRKDYPPKE